MAPEKQSPAPGKPLPIQDAASWILRIGVGTSVAVMILGILISFFHGNLTRQRILHARFNESFGAWIWELRKAEGLAVIEIGILLLVLTPIMRVAASVVLFATEERDWIYTFTTFVVLLLTLAALLFLR